MNKKILVLLSMLLFFVQYLPAQKEGFIFNNQSDNIEVNTLASSRVNIVCSNENIYKFRIVPDEGIKKVHFRIIAPKTNIVIYDNAKEGYTLEKTLNMQNSLVVMVEIKLVATEDDLEDEDFVSNGWVALLIEHKLK